jgi:hypothetical protein
VTFPFVFALPLSLFCIMDPSKPEGSVAPIGEEHHAVFSDEVRQEHHAVFGFGGTARLEALAKECGHGDDDEDAVEEEPENPFLESDSDKPHWQRETQAQSPYAYQNFRCSADHGRHSLCLPLA